MVVPWTETNRPHTLELQVENEDGQALLATPVKAEIRVGRPASLKDGTDQVVPLALRLGPVTLEREGRYALILRSEGEETARTAFDLAAEPAPATSGEWLIYCSAGMSHFSKWRSSSQMPISVNPVAV